MTEVRCDQRGCIHNNKGLCMEDYIELVSEFYSSPECIYEEYDVD